MPTQILLIRIDKEGEEEKIMPGEAERLTSGRCRLAVLSPPGESREVAVEHAEANRLELRSDVPVQAGAAVRLDWDDELWLGEVCFCCNVSQGYRLGVEIEQRLRSVSSLAALAKRLQSAGRDPIP